MHSALSPVRLLDVANPDTLMASHAFADEVGMATSALSSVWQAHVGEKKPHHRSMHKSPTDGVELSLMSETGTA